MFHLISFILFAVISNIFGLIISIDSLLKIILLNLSSEYLLFWID
jgi:hypothetical protein